MKRCNKCNKEKEEIDFNKSLKKFDGLQSVCRECNKQNLKDHYYKNPAYYKDKKTKRKINVKKYINSKKTKCVNCKETHISCLDFHHIGNKEINIAEIANLMWKKERIDAELKKCIVLCANCHRKLHWEEKNTLFV